jgi:hypothetical protein
MQVAWTSSYEPQSTMDGKIMPVMNRKVEEGNRKLKAAVDAMRREIDPLHPRASTSFLLELLEHISDELLPELCKSTSIVVDVKKLSNLRHFSIAKDHNCMSTYIMFRFLHPNRSPLDISATLAYIFFLICF